MDDSTGGAARLLTSDVAVLRDFTPKTATTPLDALYFPPKKGEPPFPAVVISEGLGGLKKPREPRYGRFLAEQGYAALVIDSFGTRGYGRAPHPLRAVAVTETMMLADAFAGLTWLAAKPEIDATRISNIGFSYGGMIVILTAYEQIRRHFVPGAEGFAAHISYYGPTVPRLVDYRTTGAPVAILNGALDANFDPRRLDLIAGDLENGGSSAESIVFDGAYHQWDCDDFTVRHDRFNISQLATRIDPDYTIIDERTGHRVTGRLSRLAMLARSVSLAGYDLKRDADVMRDTDEILLRYLATARRESR